MLHGPSQVSSLWSSIAAMKAELDALGAEYEEEVRRVCADRVKALGAQQEELTVTFGQLRIASALIATGNTAQPAAACVSQGCIPCSLLALFCTILPALI